MKGEVSFKGVKVNYSFTGQGSVVVWLHGFMEDKSIWDNQVAYFDPFCANLCIDLLGHGNTENLKNEHNMELQADAVLKVLDVLEIDSFVLVGHSMGGYVGLALLEKIKNRISKIVLLNSTSYADTKEKLKNRERLFKVIPKQKEIYARLGIINLFAQDTKVSMLEIENLIEIAKRTSVEGILAAILGMMNRKSRVALFKNFEGNKLIISGKKDVVLSTKISFAEAEFVGAKFIQLQGGHMSYLEAKTELNTLLKSFFKV